MSRTPETHRGMNGPDPGVRLRAAFSRRRAGDRTPRFVWPAYALLAALALAYTIIELIGMSWPLQKAQPVGAKLKPTIRISATN